MKIFWFSAYFPRKSNFLGKKSIFSPIFQSYLLIQFLCQNKNKMCFGILRTSSKTTVAIFFDFDRIPEKIAKNLWEWKKLKKLQFLTTFLAITKKPDRKLKFRQLLL